MKKTLEAKYVGSNIIIKNNFIGTTFDYENIINVLIDAEVLSCNAINTEDDEYDMFIDSDRNIFKVNEINYYELVNNGTTCLIKRGKLIDFIDLENDLHAEYLKWFYNNDLDYAVNAMKLECQNLKK